jgi:hypothetical protein
VLLLLPKPKGEALMIRKLLLIGVAALLAAFWMRQAFIAEPTNAAQTAPSQQTQPVGTSGSSGAKPGSFDAEIARNAQQMIEDGRKIFRFDTFGDEAFWGGQLKLHQAIAGAKFGGVGAGLSPAKALELGLKVDSEMVPAQVASGIKAGTVDLNDPANTLALLKVDAVVGVKAFMEPNGNVRSIGIQCALCHSTVDDSFAPGIGRRLDGWPNRDLNVGAIVALAPNLKPFSDLLGVDTATVTKVLTSWGPGRYDAELDKDGKAFGPNSQNASTVLPAAFGLAGVNLHTYSGWGSVPYWNAYVANTQMHGKGTFFDPRLKNKDKFPIAAKHGFDNIRNTPDLITPKLAALHFYQLSIPAPKPPAGSFDEAAAARGEEVFMGTAKCGTCHVPPLFSEPGWSMHSAKEIGIDDFQSARSPEQMYRTTPLRGLFTREKGGFYHDGRFKTLDQVVEHYQKVLNVALNGEQKRDLVQYLKSL